MFAITKCFWIIVDRSCTSMHLSKQIERYKLRSTPIEIENDIKAFAFYGTCLSRCWVKAFCSSSNHLDSFAGSIDYHPHFVGNFFALPSRQVGCVTRWEH